MLIGLDDLKGKEAEALRTKSKKMLVWTTTTSPCFRMNENTQIWSCCLRDKDSELCTYTDGKHEAVRDY